MRAKVGPPSGDGVIFPPANLRTGFCRQRKPPAGASPRATARRTARLPPRCRAGLLANGNSRWPDTARFPRPAAPAPAPLAGTGGMASGFAPRSVRNARGTSAASERKSPAPARILSRKKLMVKMEFCFAGAGQPTVSPPSPSPPQAPVMFAATSSRHDTRRSSAAVFSSGHAVRRNSAASTESTAHSARAGGRSAFFMGEDKMGMA